MNSIMYRVIQSDHYNHWKPVKQVKVPMNLGEQVMGLAHDLIKMGEHLGVKMSRDKILTNFFWPGVRANVSRFNKPYDDWQRIIQQGKVTKVPLQKLPVIDVPFKHNYEL